MSEYSVTNVPVVIDNGSGVVKAGFAGQDVPKAVFSSFVGRPKHVRVMAGAVSGDHFVGSRAEELRGLLKVTYPMEHGVVTDWNDMERVWQHLYTDHLKVHPEQHPVLLTEAPLNPRRNREKAAELFFETFNVPALFVSMQAVLSLYSSGRTTGVVLDSGDGVTHAVPIYDGFALQHSIQRSDVAGRDVTRSLQLLMRKAGYNFRTSAEFEVVRSMKESCCYVALNPRKEEEREASERDARVPPSASAAGSDGSTFMLPDGNIVRVGAARFRAPEILFKPELIGDESPGIHQLLGDSILRSDMDLRRELYQNIVLSGGSSLLPGFGDRLLSEIKKPKDIKIKMSSPPERKYSTWIGGSILASLNTFRKMWVSAEEYKEEGSFVLHRKTF